MLTRRSSSIFHRRIIQVLVIVLLFGVLIYVNPRSLFQGVREVLWFGTTPFMYVGHKVGNSLNHFYHAVSSIGTVRSENQALREKVVELESRQAQIQDMKRENENLRNTLSLLPRDKYELEVCSVVGYDPYGTNDWLVINKGRKHGLEKGMPVIVQEGALVGSIEEVFYTTSHVRLITHPESTINAHVASTYVKGLVRGRYGLGLLLDRVLQTDNIQVGEYVVTSEIGETFPPGLYIGQVQEVRRSDDDLFQQAVLTSPVDLSQLPFVSIIKMIR